jgi:hypothetical protein
MPAREEITADETVRSTLSWSGGKFAQINGPFRTSHEAFDIACARVETCRLEQGLPPLSVIGDFVLPPLDGGETRDFQTLHFDFGLPLDPKVEGSLARIVEAAAAERSPTLPSVKAEPGFLCGLEFDSLPSELAFFGRHGLRIDDAEIDIHLQPGELLLFDNLALAHGRRGTRQPGELRQRVYGHHLPPADQRKLRDHVLTAFQMQAGR